MEEKTKLLAILTTALIILITFTVTSILKKNYEFVFYSIFIYLIIVFIAKNRKRFNITTGLLVAMVLFGTLHILGGNIHVESVRLYDVWLLEGILKYDNLVHLLGGVLSTIIAYNLLNQNTIKDTSKDTTYMLIVTLLIALGLSALNEILELFAVLHFNAAEKVGDYLNNAYDLLFGLIGSLIGTLPILLRKNKNDN